MSNPAEPTPEDIFNDGVAQLNQGNLSAALASFEEVIRRDPGIPAAHWMKGITLSAQGNYREAVLAFQSGLDLVPDEPFALYNMGLAYMHSGNWDEALRALRVSIQMGVHNPMAILMLGFASGAHFGAVWPVGFGEWMRVQLEDSQQNENLELNLEDPITVALLAFAYAALGHADEAEETAVALTDLNPALAQRLAPALRDAIDSLEPKDIPEDVDEENEAVHPEPIGLPDISDVDLGEPLINPNDDAVDWEEQNTELRRHLARFAHFSEQDIEPAPESFEELYRAFLEGYFVVPLEEEPQEIEENGETRISFTLRLRPHDAFGGQLCAVAFTGSVEAAAFLDPDAGRHRVVLPGSVLASMLSDMARVLEPDEDDEDSEDEPGLGALIVNPSGPYPYVFTLREILMLASGGVPLHANNTVVAQDEDLSVRRYEHEELESPSPRLLKALRTALAETAGECGLQEVVYFEVTIGQGQPHLGIGVSPGTDDILDRVGNLVLPILEEIAGPHAVYDVVALDGDLGEHIRQNSQRLWPDP
jgi:tetratricopeptide (TPR) repeat protein